VKLAVREKGEKENPPAGEPRAILSDLSYWETKLFVALKKKQRLKISYGF